jgi:hypothetical protein
VATRLYLRDTTVNGGPTGDRSTGMPNGTLSQPTWATRDLDAAKGASQVSVVHTHPALTTHHDGAMRCFVSAALGVTSIAAVNWTFALAATESNSAADTFNNPALYVWRPGTNAVVGYIVGGSSHQGTGFGAEAGTPVSQVVTVAGAAVTGIQAGDKLVFEWWHHWLHTMATAYTSTILYNGTQDVEQGISNASCASYVEGPDGLFGGAPLVGTIGQAVETDTAHPVTTISVSPVGQAAATGTAQAITTQKRTLVGQAVETDTAGAITRPDYNSIIDLDNPIGHWKLGESAGATTAVDRKGNRNGTVSAAGVTFGQTGLLAANNASDTAALFNPASSGKIDIASTNTAPYSSSTAKTIEGWIKTTQTNATFRPIFSIANSYGLFVKDGILKSWNWDVGGGQSGEKSSGVTVADGVRHHVALTIDGSGNGQFYVDGQPAGAPVAYAVPGHGTAGAIGWSTSTQFFDGTLDEVAVYNTALSAARIEAHYDAGAGAGGPLIGAIGQASETDTAQAVAHAKTRMLGQPVEVDAAQPVTGRTVKTLGQATELDAAQPVARAKARVVGTAVETGTAQPVTGRTLKLIGQPVETDVAQTVGRVRARVLGQLVEADTAQPVTGRTVKTVGQAVDTEVAQPVTGRSVRVLGQASETGTAQPVAVPAAGIISQTVEVDAAQPVGRLEHKTIGQAVETSTALTVTRVHRRTLGQPAELDVAQPLGRLTTKAVGQALEVGVAQPIARRHTRVLAQVTEASVAQPVVARTVKTIGQPAETDTAQPVGRRSTQIVGQAVETGTAQRVLVPKRVTVGQAAATSTAQPIAVKLPGRVGQAIGVDTAQPVTGRSVKAVGQATAASTAQPVTRRSVQHVGQATDTGVARPITQPGRVMPALEVDTATHLGVPIIRTVGQAVESGTARPVARTKRVVIGAAGELDTAGSVTLPKFATVGQAIEVDVALPIAGFKGAIPLHPGHITQTAAGHLTFVVAGHVTTGPPGHVVSTWAGDTDDATAPGRIVRV